MRCLPLLLLLSLALFGCKQKEQTAKSVEMEESAPETPIYQALVDAEKFAQDSDPISIKSAKMSGDFLELIVTYSGGCEQHDFELLSNGFYMKSLPPKLSLKLLHNANNDACRSLIEQPLSFNVKNMRYAGEGPLILLIEGMKKETLYRY